MVVVPSIQSEGLPKVVTEALAMGKPVLASDRGGSFELIKPGKNGWFLEDPKDIDKFSSQLREILQDRKKILQLSNNAFTHDRTKLGIEKSSKEFFDFVLYQPSKSIPR
jgi:glycosyltransferase involved in cell wall biosynthesis